MVSAQDVADYIIWSSHESGSFISNLKLQKLRYYVQAWHLAVFLARSSGEVPGVGSLGRPCPSSTDDRGLPMSEHRRRGQAADWTPDRAFIEELRRRIRSGSDDREQLACREVPVGPAEAIARTNMPMTMMKRHDGGLLSIAFTTAESLDMLREHEGSEIARARDIRSFARTGEGMNVQRRSRSASTAGRLRGQKRTGPSRRSGRSRVDQIECRCSGSFACVSPSNSSTWTTRSSIASIASPAISAASWSG